MCGLREAATIVADAASACMASNGCYVPNMSFGVKPECQGQLGGPRQGACPACGVGLDAEATPADSIVICSRCCTPLLWDGTFSILTAEQMERLSIQDQARLEAIVLAQGARNESRKAN
jgi:hypothetical protein